MVAFLALVAVVCGVLGGPLVEAFMAAPPLNGVILGVLLIGIVFIFRQVFRLVPEVQWIETYWTNAPGASVRVPPSLLVPVATPPGDRQPTTRPRRSATSTQSMMARL